MYRLLLRNYVYVYVLMYVFCIDYSRLAFVGYSDVNGFRFSSESLIISYTHFRKYALIVYSNCYSSCLTTAVQIFIYSLLRLAIAVNVSHSYV